MTARTTPPQLADPQAVAEDRQSFIADTVSNTGADGIVVNVSGGIDSAVSATLAAEALGSDRVLGLILPTDANRSENTNDAIQVAEELVIDYRVIELQDLLDAFTKTVSTVTREVPFDPMSATQATMTISVGTREDYVGAVGNAAARIRMMVAYFEANTTNRLVLGTGNRTEHLLGYFTKYGDGGVDLNPIGDLYKSEVRQLASAIDIREDIITKEPTAGLWSGQADEVELGASYDDIDTILWNLIELDTPVKDIAAAIDIDATTVERFSRMVEDTEHKRRKPISPVDCAMRPVRD